MKRGPNLTRRKDIEAAIARAGDDDMLELSALATIWGTSKTNFVNAKAQMAEFPAPVVGPKNSHHYPAKAALRVMLAFETRHDAMKADRARLTGAIMGRGRQVATDETLLPVNELATLSRVMAETEQRERDQRLYAPLSQIAATAGTVFSLISGRLGNLANQVDPNGRLDPGTRAIIDTEGRNLTLLIHGEMKYMLSGYADPGPRQPSRRASANGRSRRARARR